MDLVAILQGWYREFYWVQVVSQRLCSWRLWLLLSMPSSCEARPPYIVLQTALKPSLLLIRIIKYIVLRYGANLHGVGLGA